MLFTYLLTYLLLRGGEGREGKGREGEEKEERGRKKEGGGRKGRGRLRYGFLGEGGWTPLSLSVGAGPETTKVTSLSGNQSFTFPHLGHIITSTLDEKSDILAKPLCASILYVEKLTMFYVALISVIRL